MALGIVGLVVLPSDNTYAFGDSAGSGGYEGPLDTRNTDNILMDPARNLDTGGF